MKINLVCSDKKKPILYELLASRNISIDENAGTCIVESGFLPPPNKLCILFDSSNLFELMDMLSKLSGCEDEPCKIIGKTENQQYKVISHNLINYFEARGNYTYCITSEGEFRVKDKLYEIEANTPHDRFIRVGKSFIINITNVSEITPWFGRRLLLKFSNGKETVEVSRNYVKGFKEFLGM